MDGSKLSTPSGLSSEIAPAKQPQGRLPNFLIIGASRSGTTTLHYVFGQHPQIYMSPVKETNFFSFQCSNGEALQITRVEDIENIDKRSIKTLEDYYAQFRAVTNETAIGETSPSYLLIPEVPPMIHRTLLDAKIIAILRQPIDKAYSHYLRKCQTNIYRFSEDFGEVLEQDDRRIREQGRGTSFLGFCHYYTYLKRYYDIFDRERIKICLFDDMESDPATLYEGLFRYLGVDPDFKPDVTTKYNQSGTERQPPLARRVLSSQRLRERAIRHLPPRMAQHLSRWRHKVRSSNIEKLPALSPESRRALTQKYFAQEIRQLEDLIGRDLSHWFD